MDKDQIKRKVLAAYDEARRYPNFRERFKVEIQAVIDSVIPGSVTEPYHVYHDIDHISDQAKKQGYRTGEYLHIVTNYVCMLIEAYQKGNNTIGQADQTDLFSELDDKD